LVDPHWERRLADFQTYCNDQRAHHALPGKPTDNHQPHYHSAPFRLAGALPWIVKIPVAV
jgi:hypothetical protein